MKPLTRHASSIDSASEWRRSNPDIVVYLPKGGEARDGDNEHFLAFESPNGIWPAESGRAEVTMV